MKKVMIAIHAGAGKIDMKTVDKWRIDANLGTLKTIMQTNYAALQGGASALDIVEQAVIALENDEGFNAGRGSVLNSHGVAEMDAAIMDGKNQSAGAVAAVRRIKNPISAARAVMEYSKHVLLVAEGAEAFSQQHQLTLVEPTYFSTPHRVEQLHRAKSAGHVEDIDVMGTVGCVVLDIHGNLAAATSTGGKANKMPGCVGDSPILGAGTWADNSTCAVSATGDGEVFMRSAFAHEIHAYLYYKTADLKLACKHALERAAALGGEGGCIAISKEGELVTMFNTSGMYRGWIDAEGQIQVAAV